MFGLRRRGAPLINDLVAIAPFENKTGDPSLDLIGDMAADWISHGVGETRIARVVDPSSVAFARTGSGRSVETGTRDTGREIRRARAFAEGFGAGKVVWGSFYRRGDSLTFLVRLSSTAEGEVLSAIDPITGPTHNPLVAISAVRQQVLGALLRLNNLGSGALPPVGRAPSYDAYVAFLQGLDFITRYQTDPAIERFQVATALDSNFFAPRLWIVEAYEAAQRRREADSVLDLLEPHRTQLTPYERAFFGNYRATLSGDHGTALQMSREMADIAPGPLTFLLVAQDALIANRPREAATAFDQIDVARSFFHNWDGYWSWALEGHHMLGENDDALRMARKGLENFPESAPSILAEAKILAAMGRVTEAKAAIERGRALPEPEEASHLSFFAMVCKELAGRRDPAASVIGAAGLAGVQIADSLTPARETARAGCLACAGRWAELATMAAARHRANPTEWDWLGLAGIAAAHLSDRAEAERIDRQLAAIADRYSFGGPDFSRARIAAQLGEADRAVGLLQQSFARGFSYLEAIETHAPEFFTLAARRDFQELMQPKG